MHEMGFSTVDSGLCAIFLRCTNELIDTQLEEPNIRTEDGVEGIISPAPI